MSIILQIDLQCAKIIFRKSLLFAAWDVYFSVCSVVWLINKQTNKQTNILGYSPFLLRHILSHDAFKPTSLKWKTIKCNVFSKSKCWTRKVHLILYLIWDYYSLRRMSREEERRDVLQRLQWGLRLSRKAYGWAKRLLQLPRDILRLRNEYWKTLSVLMSLY